MNLFNIGIVDIVDWWGRLMDENVLVDADGVNGEADSVRAAANGVQVPVGVGGALVAGHIPGTASAAALSRIDTKLSQASENAGADLTSFADTVGAAVQAYEEQDSSAQSRFASIRPYIGPVSPAPPSGGVGRMPDLQAGEYVDQSLLFPEAGQDLS